PAPAFTPEMEETTQAYIAQLKEMTEMLSRFTAQAESLSHDAEQMSALNRNLAGINAIYEMQLRSASTQINTIDQVHEQTRKMARQIEELNAVYARMLQAVQVK
ncbi:gliding motility protein GldL, partial [Bacteroides cellulosilyticus]